MSHAFHFLERTARLSEDEVELAMALYRDPVVVKVLLASLGLPDGAERVALSLGHPVDGPFVVLTRDGQFVTCLGEKMSHGLYTVPKPKVDAAFRDISRLIELSKKIKFDGYDRPITRLFKRHHRLTREEFLRVVDWYPFISHVVVNAHRNSMIQLEQLSITLDRKKGSFSKFDEPMLKNYTESIQFQSQLLLVMGSDSYQDLSKMMLELERNENLAFDTYPGWWTWPYNWSITQNALLSSFFRAIWMSARLGKLALLSNKRVFLHPGDDLEILASGYALTAIAACNKKTRAEISKLMHRVYEPVENKSFDKMLRRFVEKSYQLTESLEDPRGLLVTTAKILAHAVDINTKRNEYQTYEEIPEEWALPLLLNQSNGVLDKELDALFVLSQCATGVANVKAEEFFWPKAYQEKFSTNWSKDLAISQIKARRKARPYLSRPAPRAAPKPGRNEPCPCGSGKKYKSCCIKAADKDQS